MKSCAQRKNAIIAIYWRYLDVIPRTVPIQVYRGAELMQIWGTTRPMCKYFAMQSRLAFPPCKTSLNTGEDKENVLITKCK